MEKTKARRNADTKNLSELISKLLSEKCSHRLSAGLSG
jgi:hypothetical protein